MAQPNGAQFDNPLSIMAQPNGAQYPAIMAQPNGAQYPPIMAKPNGAQYANPLIMAQPNDAQFVNPAVMTQTQPNATQFSYPPMPQPQPSGTQFVQPQAVIGPQYCAPYPVDLSVVRKVLTISDGNFAVTDTGGNVIFKVKGVLFSIKTRRLILDAAGTPIMTLKPKLLTAHDRWLAFRGDSLNASNLIFTAKRSSFLQFKVKLHVFLANTTQEDVCDYKVEGSWNEKSCTVYHGQSSNIVAQMHKKQTVQSIVMGKDNFSVTIYPNIDYAFIVALIVILDEINQESKEE